MCSVDKSESIYHDASEKVYRPTLSGGSREREMMTEGFAAERNTKKRRWLISKQGKLHHTRCCNCFTIRVYVVDGRQVYTLRWIVDCS